MSAPDRPKQFPRYDTDIDAERFVAEADLSEYHFSGFQSAEVDFTACSATLGVRLPQSLLMAIEDRAKDQEISPLLDVRGLIERDVSVKGSSGR